MPLGNPIRKQNESRIVSVLATEGQTVFTVQGGYTINQISVFRNGVRLSNSEDFTAGDGSTVTLNNAANIDDRIEFHIFDRFTVQNAIIGAASTQTISGDLVLNGKLFGELDVPSINTGIATVTELDLNGKGDISSDLTITRHLSVGGITTTQALNSTTGTFSDDVGIGTATASRRLHVADYGDHGAIRIEASGNTKRSGIEFYRETSAGIGKGGAAIWVESDTSNSNGKLRFGTASNAGLQSQNTDMILDHNGNVGINSEAPNTRLDVIESYVNRTWTPGTSLVSLFERNGNSKIGIVANATSFSQIDFGDTNDDNVGYIRYDHSDDSMSFRTNATDDRLRILSNGAIGIGTTGARGATVEIQDVGATGPCLLLAGATNAEGDLAVPVDQDFNIGHWNNVDTFTQRFKIDTTGTIEIAGDLSIADKIIHTGDTNTAIRFPSADTISAETAGSERFRITSGGNVNIGGNYDETSHPLNVSDSTKPSLALHTGTALRADLSATSGICSIRSYANNPFTINIGGSGETEALRIDSGGRLLVNHASGLAPGSFSAKLSIEDTNSAASLSITRNSANNGAPVLLFGKSRGTSVGANTIVQDNDQLGEIRFYGADGTDRESFAALIKAEVDGTPGANDMPGCLIFSTTADGAAASSERMRISSVGHMGINKNNPDQEIDIKAIDQDATIRLTGNNDATIEMYSDNATANLNMYRINSDASGGLRFQSYGTGTWSSAMILYGHGSDSGQAVARFGNGTESLPAISFIDDTDSGFYRESNNDIRFAIGGGFVAKFGDGFRVMTTAGSIYNDDATSSAGFQVDGSSKYTAMSRYQGTPVFVNRMSQDGNLISFYESGSNVGAISVSGNTVTYGAFLGNHKGRLSDGSKPTILPGTILENINQSIEWKTVTISNVGSASSTIVLPYYGEKTSGIETVSYDNIEYNGTVGYSANYQPKGDNKHVCVKVSDTASSKSVAGVFVDWNSNANDAKDNGLDEPYNDLNVGGVGNFFIRIKSGETIANGDLVESNGDGTGKVQSDDIIRSKTVGKITSTNVIKTYDDGSFLVTAVLYAG